MVVRRRPSRTSKRPGISDRYKNVNNITKLTAEAKGRLRRDLKFELHPNKHSGNDKAYMDVMTILDPYFDAK